jgi:hypothetical protein
MRGARGEFVRRYDAGGLLPPNPGPEAQDV